MMVIPAVDIKGGKCVRLTQGKAEQETVYAQDPIEMARRWEERGAARLHVVDLDGAFQGQMVNLEVVKGICGGVRIPVQLGGGLRSVRDIRTAFEAGVRWVILGTAAVSDQAFLKAAVRLYRDRLMVSLDVRDGRVFTEGWVTGTGVEVGEVAREVRRLGVRTVVVTDISRDGTLEGVNLELIHKVLDSGLKVIAAGGVSSLEDIRSLGDLSERGLVGVIIGKALYSGAVDFKEAFRFGEGSRFC